MQEQYSNHIDMQATPRLSEDKVHQCVDRMIGGDYPLKDVAKVYSRKFCIIHGLPYLAGTYAIERLDISWDYFTEVLCVGRKISGIHSFPC
jgi:hypothetical protein